MFVLAFLIGIYAYLIFLLGMIGILFTPVVALVSFFFWVGVIWYFRESILQVKQKITLLRQRFFLLCLGLLFLQAFINVIGVFGPEVGFDALWYHLELPKLYTQYHAIVHIPGGLLYYTDMPKLTEMLYTAALSLHADILTRCIHYLFGVLTCIALYKIGRKFFSPVWALLAVVIFYSNLVVGWESVSAYVDLSRTFFEVMALWAFIEWNETKKQEWFIKAALLMGLAISVKLIAVSSLLLFGLYLLLYEKQTLSLFSRLKRVVSFVAIALLSPLPWFFFAFIHTGNPVFPLFTNYSIHNYWQLVNPLFFINSTWELFTHAADPLTPVYIAVLPFLIVLWKKLSSHIFLLLFFAVGGFVMWYLTPQTGGGRFVLSYLPVFSLVATYIISLVEKKVWQNALIVFVLLCSLISIGYRGIANTKVVPLLLGRETNASYLTKHLHFPFGDFYDTDGYFSKTIKPTDTVLLYGFHNLYYMNFPFIDNSWMQTGDRFNYVAVQGNGLPGRFKYWNLVYFNPTTHVRLYSLKGQQWKY